jgi:uncharacterized membrane protein
MSDSPRNKQSFVRECHAKARVLSKAGLVFCIIFVVAAFRIYPFRPALNTLFILSVVMVAMSIAFHLIMKKAADILGKHPSDEQILKWGNFIELYYVPKCFIKKEKNP